MVTKVAYGQRIAKSEKYPDGWKDLTKSQINLDVPTVICLGGDGTIGPRSANAMAKYANQLLGRNGLEDNEEIQVLSVYFDGANRLEMTNSRFCHRSDDKMSYTAEEQNPNYIYDLYEDIIKKNLYNQMGGKIAVSQAQKKLRNLNILAFCHGDYVTCKLNEVMKQDMLSHGYSAKEIDSITKQVAVVSVVPQDKLSKSSFSKIGFASLDDYHYDSHDSSAVTDMFELDSNECSVIGIVERPTESKAHRSRMFYLDNLLDYNSIEDKFSVWLGKTEKLHQMTTYINLDYNNEFGIKSATGKTFSLMIAQALQNCVSNSCQNVQTENLMELKLDEIFKNNHPAYKTGESKLNANYLSIDVEAEVNKALTKGQKLDNILYPQPSPTLLTASHQKE